VRRLASEAPPWGHGPHELAICQIGKTLIEGAGSSDLASVKALEGVSSTFSSQAGRKLHAVLLEKVKAASRSDAANRFEEVVEEFCGSPSLPDVEKIFTLMKSLVGQVGLTAQQVKGVEAVASALSEFLRGFQELPRDANAQAFDAGFLAIPGLLRLVAGRIEPHCAWRRRHGLR
jgi:hypothetical protein